MLQSSFIELVPRCSLTPTTARVFLAVVAATTFAVAAGFALRGMWPVLLFAGLEIAVLVWAVRASMRDGSKRETIAIDEQSDHDSLQRSKRRTFLGISSTWVEG